MPHINRITLRSEAYPVRTAYPFNLPLFQETRGLDLASPVTIFVGENGSGKSTLLEALAIRCGIHIWREETVLRVEHNPHERQLHRYVDVEWTAGRVPGSFFSAQIFREFTEMLDECASNDPGQLRYFGGKSLMTQSHGQSLMSYFRARYRIKGIYFLDEPEAALSPRTQLDLLQTIHAMGAAGHAQFFICTHSPILLACPGATLYSFDYCPVRPVRYEETDHYRVYREFMAEPDRYVPGARLKHRV